MENRPSRRRRKKIVLQEDDYIRRLSAVIRRNYFSSSSQDTQDIPSSLPPSIDAFHNKYTSQDNHSFERVLQRENERRRRVRERVYKNPGLLLTAPAQQLLLEAGDQQHVGTVVNPEMTRVDQFKIPKNPSKPQPEIVPSTIELTPIIRPSQSQPIFTWGTIESTPQRLDRYLPPPTPNHERRAIRHYSTKQPPTKPSSDSPFGGNLSRGV